MNGRKTGRAEDDPIERVRQQLAGLSQRIERLEQRTPPGKQPNGEPGAPRLAPDAGPASSEAAVPGFLTYSGSASIGGKPLKMHSHQPVAAAFSGDPDSVARIFAALGSPHRVLILRALCEGPKTGPQLEDAAGISSTGQLYHHLKELLATGLVVQPARSLYALRPTTVIALCVGLMLASDLASATSPGAATEPEPAHEDLGPAREPNSMQV